MSDISDRRTDLQPRAIGVPDTGQGLFQKFEVRRTDGSSEPGGKHEGCEYFVLDTDHDTHAKVALAAYADACEATHPLLARDLRLRHHLPENEHVVRVPIGINFDSERTHARRLLSRHCSLELRATLSAHQEEWWRLNREREASEADILQVLATGLRASRVEPDPKPKAGMVLSQSGKRSSLLGPVVIDATARWAGAIQDAEGGWDFSSENWQKFVDALSAEPPLELMTSPGVSAPESVLHPSCIARGCQQSPTCSSGECAIGPGGTPL